MKIDKIMIENFRGYKGIVSIPFSDLNVFIGKNDIGKSTILEALDIFFNDGKGAVKIDTNDRNIHSKENENVSITVVFSDLPKEIDIDAGNLTSLDNEYLLNNEKKLEIKKIYSGTSMKASVYIVAFHPTCELGKDLLLKKNSDLKKIVEDNGFSCSDKKINAELRKSIWNNCGELEEVKTEIAVDKEDAKKIWDKLEQLLPTYALFQTDRVNKDSDSEVQDPMKYAVQEILKEEELRKKLNEIAGQVKLETEKIANATLEELRKMNPEIAKELRPVIPEVEKLKWADVFKSISITSDENIPLNKRGSGVKRLILLNFFKAEAERNKKKQGKNKIIYAIEEPETSQHFSHQKKLVSALKELSKSSQILITTHSHVIVNLLPPKTYKLIIKENEGITVKDKDYFQFKIRYISSNEISYLAFDYISKDFHTELYSYIETEHNDIFKSDIDKHHHIGQGKDHINETDQKNCKYCKEYIFQKNNTETVEYISLHKYIRHQIHHPENTQNIKHTDEELRKSIEEMLNLIP